VKILLDVLQATVLVGMLLPSVAALPVQAQSSTETRSPVDQGHLVVGGAISFTSQGGDLYATRDERLWTLRMGPTIQYAVVSNLAVGAEGRVERTAQGDFSEATLRLGPAATYVIGRGPRTVYPFITLAPLWSQTRVRIGEETVSAAGIGGRGVVGLHVMLGRHVALTGGVFYLYERRTDDVAEDPLTGNTVGLEVGLTAFLF